MLETKPRNIVISPKFIEQHNFSVTEENKNCFRKFQLHKNFVSKKYKDSFYLELPPELGDKLLTWKKTQLPTNVNPEVRILIGQKLVHTMDSLKKTNFEKYQAIKNQSLENNSWNWKRMTAIVSIKPGYLFTIHVFDKNTGQKIEECSGQQIDYATAFRFLETLEISHAKHFKTAINVDQQQNSKKKISFDLLTHVYSLILSKTFDNQWLLANENIIRKEEQSSFDFEGANYDTQPKISRWEDDPPDQHSSYEEVLQIIDKI